MLCVRCASCRGARRGRPRPDAGSLALVSLHVDLPDDIARRVDAAAAQRGVLPEQFVVDAVERQLDDGAPTGGAWESVRDEIRSLVFDGSLREDIDAAVDDPELRVS